MNGVPMMPSSHQIYLELKIHVLALWEVDVTFVYLLSSLHGFWWSQCWVVMKILLLDFVYIYIYIETLMLI